MDFKEDFLNFIFLELTLVDYQVNFAEDFDGSRWIIIEEDEELWKRIRELCLKEQIVCDILDESLLG